MHKHFNINLKIVQQYVKLYFTYLYTDRKMLVHSLPDSEVLINIYVPVFSISNMITGWNISICFLISFRITI